MTTVTRKKGSMSKVYSEDAEILVSAGQDDLIQEISRHVLILGSSTTEFGTVVRVIGSPHQVQEAKALVERG